MTVAMLPALTQETGLQKYLEEIKKFPILTDAEEQDLAFQWYNEGNLASAHKLVTSHLRLVAKIAMQFRGYGLPIIDIISEGNIGLMTAVKKFNPNLGYRLATYALWWIKANIQDYILKSWSMIKMGTSSAHKKLFFNLKKVRNRLLQASGGQVASNESELIANELNVSKKDVEEMSNRFDSNYNSLNDMAYGDEGAEVIDLIIEPSDNQEAVLLERNDYAHKKNKLNAALSTLNDRERHIIYERRLRDKPTHLEELSEKFGISTERVRQIEERSMQKLILHVKSIDSGA